MKNLRCAVVVAAALAAAACGGCASPATKVAGAPPTKAELAVLERGPGGFFVRKGCYACHRVSSMGIPALKEVGPDLALAVEDAPRRFGVPVEEFLRRPSGTMALVLAARIPLDDAGRAEAAASLHEAYTALIENRSNQPAPAASHEAPTAGRKEGSQP